jgi:hypothetical protein
MSRQQALADKIRRARHDSLVRELRLLQRNIVFPYTVRNVGVLCRNLASESVYSYASYRVFAVVFGFFYLAVIPTYLTVLSLKSAPLILPDVASLYVLLYVLVGLKITVHALVREAPKPRPQLTKPYPRIKI